MYISLATWRDLSDGHLYLPGDEFPWDGREIKPERLKELESGNNRAGLPLIMAVIEDKPEDPKKDAVEEDQKPDKEPEPEPEPDPEPDPEPEPEPEPEKPKTTRKKTAAKK